MGIRKDQKAKAYLLHAVFPRAQSKAPTLMEFGSIRISGPAAKRWLAFCHREAFSQALIVALKATTSVAIMSFDIWEKR